MAGPLSIFRRYQKTMLAIFGVLLMITFVVTPNSNGCSNSRGGGNAVVFSTNQGAMREQELANMVNARRMSHQFLVNAISLAVQNLRQDRTMQTIPPEEIGRALGQALAMEGIELRRDVSEESFVKSLIIARKAEELGIVITDDAIYEFLRARTVEKVTPEQFRQIHTMMKFSKKELFNALRLELLSARLQRMYFGINAIVGAPPGVRWDYFERLNHRATAQAMALPVDGFLAKVGKPTEEQLRALYEKRRINYAIPGEPEPGFHQPEKGKFEYFKADYNKFADKIEISEADIQEYYEQNKQALFRYRGFSAESESDPKADQDAASDEGSTPSEVSPATESVEESATPDEPADTPDDESPSPTTEEATSPTAEPPSEEAPNDPPASPEGAGGDDTGGEDATAPPDDEVAAQDDASEPPTDDSEEPSLNPPLTSADETTSDSKEDDPVATKAQVAADAAAGPSEPVIEPDPSLLLPESILSGPDPEFEPLWRVETTIRDTLRRQQATQRMREAFDHLAEVVDAYGSAYTNYEQDVQDAGGKSVGEPPAEPDYAKLASEAGMTFHTTKMLSLFDVSETELGKTFINGNEPFMNAAFSGLRLRIPRQSADVEGNQYLFWKVAESADVVPSFDDAREAVTRAWRFEQARQLALKSAQELAAEVNSSGKTLQELHGAAGSYKVVETGEFTWMTESSALSPDFMPSPPEISKVEGIDRPGDAFMQAVFDLEPKQAGAAFNEPETIAYVVQLIDSTPATNILREQFIVAPYRGYSAAAAGDERKVELDWMAQLEEEAGLVWDRPPDQRLR